MVHQPTLKGRVWGSTLGSLPTCLWRSSIC